MNDEMISTREAFEESLCKFGGKQKNLIFLHSDMVSSSSTQKFEKFYHERCFNFGTAEDCMVPHAAGMSIRGNIPCVYSTATHITGKSWLEIKNMICYPNINVKIAGTGCGLSAAQEGAQFHAVSDIATMRSIPNMKVICPADAVEVYFALEQVLQDYGPTYIRLSDREVPIIYGKDHKFKIGYGDILKYGDKVSLIATGDSVHECIKAAEMLESEGISTLVANMSTIEPIDEKLVRECATKTKVIFTVEDHFIKGGLGSAVNEVLHNEVTRRIYNLGIEKFAESGKAEDLYKKYGLDAETIYKKVKDSI